jgi:hypothetical protein
MDFTTGIAVGLILILPVIWWWAYNKEHGTRQHGISTGKDYRQFLKKLKPKKSEAKHPTFLGIETDTDTAEHRLSMDDFEIEGEPTKTTESKRDKENKWKHFPSNSK